MSELSPLSMCLRFGVVVLLCTAAAADRAMAQTSEEINELDAEIEEIGLVRERVRQRLLFLDRKVDALKQFRVAVHKMEELESRLDAEDDESKIENLERLADANELRVRQAEFGVELANQRLELHEALGDLPPREAASHRRHGERLIELHRERRKLGEALFEAYRDGPESAERSLERKADELDEQFGLSLEALRVRNALWWAREEDEEEAIDELEAELRHLHDELGPEHVKDWRDEERDDREEQRRERSAPEPPRVKRLRVTELEVDEAAGFSMTNQITPWLKRFCYECHGSGSASGDLDLEELVSRQPLVVNRQTWRNIREQVAVGSMPPADSETPTEDERRRVVAFLTHSLDRFDYSTVKSAGFEPSRRLTHQEYDNAIRDLFGVDLKPTRRFPPDLSSKSGFTNDASALAIQPLLMERYIGSSEYIVDTLLPTTAGTSGHHSVRMRLVGDTPLREAAIRFARRAFRRPLRLEETTRLAGYFESVAASTGSEFEAFRGFVQMVLISPSFLIRSESEPDGAAAGSVAEISDVELANRLSFFLWASIPDERLMRDALSGNLRNNLAVQVKRLIANERSKSLGDVFVQQWLGLNNLDRVQRDPIDNPWATDSLVEAMRGETSLFFHSLVRENAPITRLIDADYTFANAELAGHYGLGEISGDELKRVSVDPAVRGGILAQGSMLALTSTPHRTSPVVRGNWILSTLLGTPPPPPPPNASEFDEELEEAERLTSRQRLERHRNQPNCYACHSQIDPLGFALERYDWFGQLKRRSKIDTNAQLPDGHVFRGLEGLKNALVNRRADDLAEQVTRKMLEYALGRQLDYYDEWTVRQILAQLKRDDYRLHTLILAIVESETFQSRQRLGQPLTGDTP